MVTIRAAAGTSLVMNRYNFDRLTDIDSVIVQQTSSALVIDVDGYRYSFSGSGVRYNGFGEPVAGTITGITISSGGAVEFQVGGLAIPASTFYLSTYAPNSPLPLVFAGNDDLRGGDLGDVLHAFGGHDILMGGPGDDSLAGAEGNDHIYGQSPNGGEDGNDTLDGGDGSDYIQGNAGDDWIYGGRGSDRLNGGQGQDWIYGREGNDTINGNRGDDRIHGEAGNDVLRGGQGNDTIYGGDGDDILMGDRGADYLEDGSGKNIFVFGPGTSEFGETLEDIDHIFRFTIAYDHISLGFEPETVLRPVITSDEPLTIEAARAYAQASLDAHPGDHEVAIIPSSVGNLILWASDGGATVDSIVSVWSMSQVTGLYRQSDTFELEDFI